MSGPGPVAGRAGNSTAPGFGGRLLGGLTALVVAAATLVAVAPAAPAQEKAKVTQAKDLPALPATASPKIQPEAIKGDFADAPPHPDQLGDPNRPSKSAFDPATSRLLEAETTPTKLTYANVDGTRTDVLTAVPTRFKDAKGAWVDIDLALVAGSGGSLRAKAAERSPTVAAKADGIITLPVPGGTIELRHRDATPVAAVLDKGAATYPKALGRRDLRVALVDGGVETFVVLPDAGAGGSFVTEVTLPAGFTARDAEAGVEFLDASATVVATMANGWATDAHQPIPALAPVAVKLLAPATPAAEATPPPAAPAVSTTTTVASTPPTTVAGATPSTAATTTTVPTSSTTTAAPTTTTAPARKTTTVSVEAGVDPAWLADAARAYPITIDPSTTVAVPSPARDTMVFNGPTPTPTSGPTPSCGWPSTAPPWSGPTSTSTFPPRWWASGSPTPM